MTIGLAIAIVTVVGLLGAVILVLAAKFMHVEEDPRIGEVNGCLPGANCGACGYAGCADYAKAIVEAGAAVNKCVPGGAKTADAVAAVMGVDAGATAVVKAVAACQGKPGVCGQRFDYSGIQSCAAAAALHGGPKACVFSCIGLGDCVKACKFDAIHIVEGIAQVDTAKCTGCGACAAVCPNHVIEVVPEHKRKPVVLCQNKDKGAQTRKACTAGCIGCMKCAKACPREAITVENNVAYIDQEKCVGCQLCVKECPVGVIHVPAAM